MTPPYQTYGRARGRECDLAEWTVHGGKLGAARRAYPHAPSPWLDLSTGINPDAWPGAAGVAIDWRALPDDGALADLEAAAAAHFGATPASVCALPGTEIALRLLDTLGLPAPARYVRLGYRTHGEAFADARAIDRDALPRAITAGGTVLFANPNNPDGRVLPAVELFRLAEDARSSGGWLVIDEAFADAVPEASLVPHLDPGSPVVILRSFGKFFGLAGVRLGFAIGPVERIARLRRRIGSWPVSAAALAIGTAAYRDAAWIAGARERLGGAAAALDAVLARHGLTAVGDCPLFRLIDAGDGAGLFDRLARRGILARPFDDAPGWLRFGLPGSAAALDRLDRALAGG